MFGKALNWDYEYPKIKQLKDDLIRCHNDNGLNRGSFQKFQSLADKAAYEKKHQLNESWRWFLAYDFSRAITRKASPEVKELLNRLKVQAFQDKFHSGASTQKQSFIELLGLASRWAQLLTRKKN